MKNIVFLLSLTLLLAGILTLEFKVKPAQAWIGTVHIRSDGSVDPPSAPIERNGDLYTLTSSMESDNFYGAGLVIERNDMTLDGAGYIFELPTAMTQYVPYGIEIAGVSNTTVKDIEIDGGMVSVIFDCFSLNNSVMKSKLRPDYYGIVFESGCQGNVVSENNITSRLAWTDISLSDSSNNTIVGNVIGSSGYQATIQMSNSSNNRIYHNNIYGRVDTGNLTNVWDDGYPSGGNYWSDYDGTDLCSGPYQNETRSDGVGDSPYTTDANNTDNYPLMKSYPWGPHDIGVTLFRASKTVAEQGLTVHANIMIFNFGNYTETFNVTLYVITTSINTVEVTLASRNSTTITFPWNTTGYAYDNYTVMAVADTVPGETDPASNIFKSSITVTILSDVDGNFKVDIGDISVLCDGFGSVIGPDGWYWHKPKCILCPHSPNLDIDNNGQVDMGDITTALDHFGQHYP